jgi:hypothetical protein
MNQQFLFWAFYLWEHNIILISSKRSAKMNIAAYIVNLDFMHIHVTNAFYCI